jgi:peptidyl-prolyl cis-trans isomerase D
MKWLFEAKEKEVSPMYECGDNNHLLVAVLDKIHAKGYRGLDDAQVMDMVKAEVMKDKKAEMLMEKVKGVKSVNEAKAKGATVTAISQVTFAAPVFVTATGSTEPALSGAIAATAKGKFCKTPVKGNAGVYLFSVTGKTMRPGKLDIKAQEAKLNQRTMQMAAGYMSELYANAKIVDNRYLFF